MVKPESWAKTRFTGGESGGKVVVRLSDEGVVLPVSHFAMTYGLNSIPTASAVVALGRDARTGRPSTLYSPGILDSLKQMAKVKVTLEGSLGEYSTQSNSDTPKERWKTGPHTLFIGYVAGISYRRSGGAISLVINFVQKLFDLSQSSAGSADVVPGDNNSLFSSMLYEGTGGASVGMPQNKFNEELDADINTDFSAGILKCMESLCENSPIQTHGSIFCSGSTVPGGFPSTDVDPQSNNRALGALRPEASTEESNDDSSQPQAGWLGIKNLKEVSQYTAKYPLKVSGDQKSHVSSQIGNTIFQSLAGTSMWSMLIGSLLPEFGMGIVPIANQAFLVPILPSIRSNEDTKKIKLSEIADISMTSASQRPLYGVGITGNYTDATLRNNNSNKCVGAFFVADSGQANDPAAQGMWMFQQAPRWMDDWLSTPSRVVSRDTSTDNIPDTIAKPPTPSAADFLEKITNSAFGGELEQFIPERDIEEETEGWNSVAEKYAKLLYSVNALRDRQAVITGKLRFDISPGSTVIFGVEDDEDDEVEDPEGQRPPTGIVGFVARVTVTIDSQNANAMTMYELTHTRTRQEDTQTEEGRFSMESHPFFDETFRWAPLVESLKEGVTS